MMSSQKRRILLVDDNEEIHNLIKNILSNKSVKREKDLNSILKNDNGDTENKIELVEYTTDSALQGEEAVELVKKSIEEDNPYLVAFVDIRMPPGIDGIETIKRIWKLDPYLEIVICTAYSDYSWIDLNRELSQVDNLVIIKKPFEFIEIQQLALTLSKKRIVEGLSRIKMQELENLVQKKTKENEANLIKIFEHSKLISLGEMAAGIAHEINNPLTIITGHTSEGLSDLESKDLSDKDKVATFKDHFEAIYKSSQRIATIVKNMVRLMRSFNVKGDSSINLLDTLYDMLILYKEKFAKEGVKFETPTIPEEILVQLSASDFQEILLNLLNNAYDAVSVLKDKNDKWIKIDFLEKDKSVNLIFSNGGPKIDEKNYDKIFDPFFTTKEVGKGTGLGLSVSLALAKKFGGDLIINKSAKFPEFILKMARK